MNTTTTNKIAPFLLEQAKKICGSEEYEDYIVYSCSSEEQRRTLSKNIEVHHTNVANVINKMAAYGENHWWVTLSQQELSLRYKRLSEDQLSKQNKEIEKVIDLRRKTRIYFQVFRCGLDTLLVPQGQLINDINDLLTPKGVVVTSWFLNHPYVFKRYKDMLKEILDNDENFQAHLKSIDSG